MTFASLFVWFFSSEQGFLRFSEKLNSVLYGTVSLSGEMRREDVVNLLREIMSSCSSFVNAQAVSITKDSENGDYRLSTKWVVDKFERDFVNNLAQKYGVKISEEDGYTVFSAKTTQ